MVDDTGDSTSLDSILGSVKDLAGTASSVYGAVTGTPQRAAPAPAPVASSTWQKYLPWAIGGVVLLVIVGVLFKK